MAPKKGYEGDERRRFEDEEERKPWTKEEREEFEETATRLRPYIRHLTTPARAPKKKDPISKLFS